MQDQKEQLEGLQEQLLDLLQRNRSQQLQQKLQEQQPLSQQLQQPLSLEQLQQQLQQLQQVLQQFYQQQLQLSLHEIHEQLEQGLQGQLHDEQELHKLQKLLGLLQTVQDQLQKLQPVPQPPDCCTIFCGQHSCPTEVCGKSSSSGGPVTNRAAEAGAAALAAAGATATAAVCMQAAEVYSMIGHDNCTRSFRDVDVPRKQLKGVTDAANVLVDSVHKAELRYIQASASHVKQGQLGDGKCCNGRLSTCLHGLHLSANSSMLSPLLLQSSHQQTHNLTSRGPWSMSCSNPSWTRPTDFYTPALLAARAPWLHAGRCRHPHVSHPNHCSRCGAVRLCVAVPGGVHLVRCAGMVLRALLQNQRGHVLRQVSQQS